MGGIVTCENKASKGKGSRIGNPEKLFLELTVMANCFCNVQIVCLLQGQIINYLK